MLTSQPSSSTQQHTPVESHFLIGQNAAGQWLALETHRLGGGMFTTCRNAIRFVERETGHRAGAYELSPKPLSLVF